jgi:hypothetical protein
MELFIAIALLCQASTEGSLVKNNRTYESHLECQQSYLHCYNLKRTKPAMTDMEAMTQCVQERK